MFYVILELHANNVFVTFSCSCATLSTHTNNFKDFLEPSCIPHGVISGNRIKSVYGISSRNLRLVGKHFRNFIQLSAKHIASEIPCTRLLRIAFKHSESIYLFSQNNFSFQKLKAVKSVDFKRIRKYR